MKNYRTFTTTIGIYDATTMILLLEYADHFTAHCRQAAIMHAHRAAHEWAATQRRIRLIETHQITAKQLNSLIEAGEIDLLKGYAFKTHSVE